ncbi:hypothetical protein FA10DRAFT_290300 [Acaromyces ingoldii]|uniref:Uncharacterized protein n=1 Tax=Acaromyces ingoldii TaxID=215250 RepID=A0A316YWL6_9BASI|nr:hypothetical protein FA10DRAFT_290300 [Acaromyces ingoldii]PWN93174.1 hypothetical protein FA10DRAFT_290300 [Acaromyces ingoldii]
MRYLSTLLLALHLAAVAYSTPISSDTSGSVSLESYCPSATTLGLRTVHYHKRNLVHFLSGGSKRDKKDKCKDKDADSKKGEASLPDDDKTEWIRRPGESPEDFLVRLDRQATKWGEDGKLNETGVKLIKALGKNILINEARGMQDPQDSHGDILKVIDGTWGEAEALKYGNFNLFKRSAYAESSNMQALERPLLHDPTDWVREADTIRKYWKPKETESKAEFSERIYEQVRVCYKHGVLNFDGMDTLDQKISDLRRFQSIPSEDGKWQKHLRELQDLVQQNMNVKMYKPGNDRTPNSPPPLRPSDFYHHFSRLHL